MSRGVVLFAILGFSVLLDTVWGVNCPKDPDNGEPTYLPHETDCGRFYECHEGSARIFDCPGGTYFDVVLDVCSYEVDCGNLLTSTKSPVTSETDTPAPDTDAPDTDAPDTDAPDTDAPATEPEATTAPEEDPTTES